MATNRSDAASTIVTEGDDERTPTLTALLRPHLPGFLIVLVFQVVGSLAGLAPLLAVVELGRTLLAPEPRDHGHVWFVVTVGAVGLFVRLVFAAGSSAVGHLVDAGAQLSLRRTLAERLGQVPLGWFSTRRTGELAKVVGDDVSAVHPLVAHTPGELVSAFVVPLASLVYLCTVDWKLTLITLIPVVAAIALVPLMMTPTRQREQRDYDVALARVSNSAVEFVQGIAVVKAFGGGERAHHRFRASTDEFAAVFSRMVRGLAPIGAGMQVALSPPFVLAVVLVGGTAMITTGDLAPADLLPFLLLGLGLTAPVAALGHGFDDVQAARRALERVRDVLAVPPMPEPQHPIQARGHRVEVNDVSFGYEDDREVLSGIDLVLEPGTMTAIVGPSGSGKSTLVQLLPRFFDPTHGEIRLGGVDLRELGSDQLSRLVSFVFQDVRLLRASIADNIALAVPDASLTDVMRVAKMASIHDRIRTLPRGYHSVIGEDVMLSGGEAQRVAIARALLSDAPVLVLDEATAFADPRTAQAFRHTLSSLAGKRTILLIAHRMETVADADTVVVLENGTIVERGTPTELLLRDDRFATLWRTYREATTETTRRRGTLSEGEPLR